jgi:hypothetical protein
MVTYDDFPFGFSWFPDEALTRTSHAIDTGDGVWLVDPVDVPEAIERAAGLGAPAGVLQLLDRHNRDCAAVAARLGVPHLRLPATVPGSPFSVVPVIDLPRWRELALWWPERRLLVVAELIGTNSVYALDGGPAGPECIRCCAWPRRGRCAATSRSTCSSVTAAACTARPPPRRWSAPTRARARTCRGCSAGCPRWRGPPSRRASRRRPTAARW